VEGQGLIVDWSEVADPGLGIVVGITDMASANGKFVVIGDRTEEYLPAAWNSVDGAHWQLADFPAAADASFELYALTAGGPGFVATGFDYDASVGVAYTSPDGQTWMRVDDPDFADQSLYWIATAAGVLVAVSEEGGVLTSTDGVAWQLSTGSGAAEMASGFLTLTSDGTTLWGFSVGGDPTNPEGQPIEVWRSADAVTWSMVASIAGSESSDQAWAAVGPAGLVLVASTFQNDVPSWMAWHSVDGVTWDPAVHSPSDVTDVIADDAGFVAVGHYNLTGGCALDETEDVGVTWTSVDGSTWREMASDGWQGREVTSVARIGRTLAGVGLDWIKLYDGTDSGMAWTATLPASATDNAPLPAPTPAPTPPTGCDGPE
jgi:hypothetical protein